MLKRAKRRGGDSIAPCFNALASRGCPDPDNAIVRKPVRTSKAQAKAAAIQDAIDAHATAVLRARKCMTNAQADVQSAKRKGLPYADLAATARRRRAEYIALTGGTDRRIIDVDQGSAVNPLVAV